MTPIKIPLLNIPQKFTISLGGNNYNVVCKWNEKQGWTLDIADVNYVNILCGIPLTTGRDLLEPHANLSFGGKLFALTDGNMDIPTLDNLGTDSNLYFVTA